MRMGPAPSQTMANENISPQLGMVHGTIQKYAGEIKQIASLKYDKFLSSLKELNEITSRFSDVGGKTLVFKKKAGTDSTFFWKGTVRICCHKVNNRTGSIESTRVLNLKDYIRLFNEISQQAAMATLKSSDGCSAISASIILTELDARFGEQEETDNECCICMDRKAEVILPCTHTYCEQCIDEWQGSHKTCPICRAAVQGQDDTWVLTEKPDTTEMAFETTGYLMGLAERTGSPAHSPST